MTWIDNRSVIVKIILIQLFIFLGNIQLQAQKKPIKIRSDLFVGANYTSVFFNEEWLDRSFRPSIGWWGEQQMGSNFSMNYNASFFLKASRVTPSVNLEWLGLDLGFTPMYEWDDLGIFLGAKASIPTNFNLVSRSGFQTREFPDSIYLRIFSLQAGIQLKLHEQVRLVLSHSLSFDKETEKNFHIGIRIPVGTRDKGISYRTIKRKEAKSQINELKNGALLVRLSNGQAKVNALMKLGDDDRAEKYKMRLREENLELVRSFRSAYDFSKVYFYYSDQSSKVKNANYQGIFLNDSLEYDSTIQLSSDVYVFNAQLTNRHKDSSRFITGYRNRTVGPFQQIREPIYEGGADNGFMAIVLFDDQFNQLQRPFPYYGRYIGRYYEKRYDQWILMFPTIATFGGFKLDKSVSILNRKLWRYYNRVNSSEGD